MIDVGTEIACAQASGRMCTELLQFSNCNPWVRSSTIHLRQPGSAEDEEDDVRLPGATSQRYGHLVTGTVWKQPRIDNAPQGIF